MMFCTRKLDRRYPNKRAFYHNTSLRFKYFIKLWRPTLVILLGIALSGCDAFLAKQSPAPEITKPKPKPVLPSAKPLERPSKLEIRYAQTALNSLGYALGAADGIWGPRSARAIRRFEKDFQIKTANGHISRLNLSRLESESGLTREQIKPKAPKKIIKPISSKLDKSVPLENAPQLIIVDRAYSVLAKPNPYSEPLTIVRAGAGIYIVEILDGWYEVVAEDQITGYIRERSN